MTLTPLLIVRDVEVSSLWLCSILPLSSAHGGSEFEMLSDPSGKVILWLHVKSSSHEHSQYQEVDMNALTGGAIFYIQVADPQPVLERALACNAKIIEDLHFNPLAHFHEFTFEDPNGYRFAVHGPSSWEAPGPS